MFAFVVNAFIVIIGSAIGLIFRKYIKKEICDAVIKVMGLVVMLIGIIGVMENMITVDSNGHLSSSGTSNDTLNLLLPKSTILNSLLLILPSYYQYNKKEDYFKSS